LVGILKKKQQNHQKQADNQENSPSRRIIVLNFL